MSIRPASLTTLKTSIAMDRKIKSSNFFYHFFTQTPFISWLFIHFIHFNSPGLSNLCCKELQPALKMPFFHLSFKEEKHFFSVTGKKCWVDSPGGFCLHCKQLWHKSAPSFSWFLPGTILSCRGSLWGSRGWCIPCCHMYVSKRAILALPMLPETVDSDGCHHATIFFS